MSDKIAETTTRTIQADVTLTPVQWADLERRLRNKALVCRMGIDDPNVIDLVLFQLFIRGQPVDRQPTPAGIAEPPLSLADGMMASDSDTDTLRTRGQ